MTEHVLAPLAAAGGLVGRMLRDAADVARSHRAFLLSLLAVVFTGAAMVWLFDVSLQEWMMAPRSGAKRRIAKALSYWGDYPGLSLGVPSSIACVGLVLRRRRLWRAALAAVLAASLAGLFVNVFRVGLGRPRPMAELPDGFYGPSIEYRLHGFPSAHATTAMATTTALAAATPVIGVPLLGVGLGVCWSRVYLRRHHPTDIYVGGWLGALFGGLLGAGARRRAALEA